MFACVLKSGGSYNASHVDRLQNQLDRPLLCLTDVAFSHPNVTTVDLKYNWDGWWSKIELFDLDGPVTYLDLDVSIVGNPDKLQREEFTMWQDPMYPEGFNSSVMSWSKTPKEVIDTFSGNPQGFMRRKDKWPYRGDQGFIQKNVNNINKYEDGLILSYKVDVKGKEMPEDAVVVVYHGKPKPWG